MAKEKENITNTVGNNILTLAFEKWGNKVWFQIVTIFLIVYLLASPIITPIVNNHFQQSNTSIAIEETLNKREAEKQEAHKMAFEKSKQSYALVKKTMASYLSQIDCEYMFLVEYHNGSENVMTGIQFCRFDITLEVSTPEVKYQPLDKWKDDIVARYDLLLSEDFNKNKLLFYTREEFMNVDKYLALQLEYIKANSYAVLNLKDNNGEVFGTIMCVSENEHMNTIEVMNCAREIETIINNTKV